MKYAILFYENAETMAERVDPVKAGAYWAGWMAYVDAIQASGVVVSGAGLEPPAAATTLRIRDGARQVQDGPFADSKERLGGFFVIEVESLDAALAWAARSPAATGGAVEVRPLLPPYKG